MLVVRGYAVVLTLIALYFVAAVATEVFVDDVLEPSSVYSYLLAGTILTSLVGFAVSVDIPAE